MIALLNTRHKEHSSIQAYNPCDTVYTEFEPALLKITTPDPGDLSGFINTLQNRLDEHLEKNSPDSPSLTDIITG